MGKPTLINEIIDNEGFLSRKLNDNDRKKSLISAKQADVQVHYLINKFKAPQCRKFFYKVVYHIPEHRIIDAVADATRSKIISPTKYFVKTMKNELDELGL